MAPKKVTEKPDGDEAPADLIKSAEDVDPDDGKAVVNLVLDAYKRGVEYGKTLNSPKKGFWE